MTRALFVICTLFLLAPLLALAAGTPQEAKSFLEKRHAEVIRILKRPAPDQASKETRDTEIRKALAELLDFEELSKRALEDHWAARSAAEQQRFVELLGQLVERSYQKNLESTMDFRVTYESATRKGDSLVVATEAQSLKNRRSPPVAIDYTLVPVANSFRVYDVTTDGVSLVANYKRQFNKIIRRNGWDALIERMEKKLTGDAESPL